MSTKPDVYEVIAALSLAGVAHNNVNWPTYAHDSERVVRNPTECQNFETDLIMTREKYEAAVAIFEAYGLSFKAYPSSKMLDKIGRPSNNRFAGVWLIAAPTEFAPLPERVNDE